MNDNSWISVTAHTPKHGESVLCLNGSVRLVGEFNERGWTSPGGYPLDSVTHWQSLPAPPKVDSFEQWWDDRGTTWKLSPFCGSRVVDKDIARFIFAAGAKANQSPDYACDVPYDRDAGFDAWWQTLNLLGSRIGDDSEVRGIYGHTHSVSKQTALLVWRTAIASAQRQG